MNDECQVCIDWDGPCETCAREIHQSWHAVGLWWIRQEMCDSSCPEHADTISRMLQVISVLPRDRARDTHLRNRQHNP